MCLWWDSFKLRHQLWFTSSTIARISSRWIGEQGIELHSSGVCKTQPFFWTDFLNGMSGNKDEIRLQDTDIRKWRTKKCHLTPVDFPAKCANLISQHAVKEKSKLKGSLMFRHQTKIDSIAVDWVAVVPPLQHRMIPPLENGESKHVISCSRFSCQVRKLNLATRRQRNIKVQRVLIVLAPNKEQYRSCWLTCSPQHTSTSKDTAIRKWPIEKSQPTSGEFPAKCANLTSDNAVNIILKLRVWATFWHQRQTNIALPHIMRIDRPLWVAILVFFRWQVRPQGATMRKIKSSRS